MARKKSISRPQILLAALQATLRGGFHSFGIRGLAAEIGFTPASLMHHFPSKEELGAAMVAVCREAWNQSLSQIEGEREGWQDRWAAMLGQIKAPPDGFLAGSAVLAICAGEFPSLPVQMQAEIRLFHMNLNGWFVRFLSQAKRRGEIPQETEIDALAAGLLAIWQGGVLLHRTGAQDMQGLMERQVAIWLDRVAVPRAV